MADTNQNPSQKPQGDSKPGLSWSQPQQNQNASQQKQSQNTQKPTNNTAAKTTADEGSSTGRVVGIIVGIVVIFALAAWGIVALRHNNGGTSAMSTSTSDTSGEYTMGSSSETSSTPETGDTTSSTPSMTAGNATFSVASNQGAGTSVALQSMSISKPTWIVVYESQNGKPGNILGAGLFFAGDTSGTVPLLRATTPGQTYLATALVDNGDRLFSVKDEQAVLDQNGQQVWTTFQTK